MHTYAVAGNYTWSGSQAAPSVVAMAGRQYFREGIELNLGEAAATTHPLKI